MTKFRIYGVHRRESTGTGPVEGSSSNGCCLFRESLGPIDVRLSFPTTTTVLIVTVDMCDTHLIVRLILNVCTINSTCVTITSSRDKTSTGFDCQSCSWSTKGENYILNFPLFPLAPDTLVSWDRFDLSVPHQPDFVLDYSAH